VIDLIVEAKTIKSWEENVGKYFHDFDVSKDFLNKTFLNIDKFDFNCQMWWHTYVILVLGRLS
jgi:hypothetical protein